MNDDRSRQATLSLFCGLLSFGFNPFFATSLSAILLGVQARGGEKRGRALAGILLGAASALISLVLLGMLEARGS